MQRLKKISRNLFLELERSTYSGIRAYLIIVFIPIGINVPTRSALVIETKDSFVSLVTDINNKSNVCKRGCVL